MSERGVLFLFSLCVVMASLVAAAWLVVTGQAAYIDGLFLLLCCLISAAAFSLYLRYLIRKAMEAGTPVKAAGREKAAAPATGKAEHVAATPHHAS